MLPGGDRKPLFNPGLDGFGDFTADGDWLYYTGRDANGKPSLFRISTAGGQPQRVGDFPGETKNVVMWLSPNGRKIAAQLTSHHPFEVSVLENFEPKH